MDRVGLAILEQELAADAAVMADAASLAAERFLPSDFRSRVRELKSFRHFFRHAYDPILRVDRLAELVTDARGVSSAFPKWTRHFSDAGRQELDKV